MSENQNDPMQGLFTQMQGAAFGLHEFYTSLTTAGFTDDQALALINTMLSASIASRMQPPGA